MEQTVVNYIFIKIIGGEAFYQSRLWITSHVVLTNFQTYSMPEALWVLSITLLSKRYKVRFAGQEIPFVYFPLIVAFGFEFFQWMHWSQGSADVNDLWGSLLFWSLGLFAFPEKESKVYLFESLNIYDVLCTACYAVVYLAHVRN